MADQNNTQPAFRMALQIVNYASPVILITYFIGTTGLAYATLQTEKSSSVSKSRRSVLVILSFLLAASYIAQSLGQFPWPLTNPNDVLIRSISFSLFWLIISLILAETKAPLRYFYVGLTAINLVVEVLACMLTFQIRSNLSLVSHLARAFQFVTIVLLIALFCSATLLITEANEVGHGHETRPLLGKATSVDLKGEGMEEGDSSDDDDDEKEGRILQQQRLEDAGGWLTYLKSFRIFLPYMFPVQNHKPKLFLGVLVVNIVLQRILNVLYPRQLGIIIDELTISRQVPWKDILLWMFYGTLASGNCGIGALDEMLLNRISSWSRQRLTYASLDHVMNLSMDFHDQKDSGEVIKAIDQAESLNKIFMAVIYYLVPAALDMVVAVWYVTYLFDIYALFIIVGMAAVYIYVTYRITLVTTTAQRILSRTEREKSKLVYESIGNWYTVACFDRVKHTMSVLTQVLMKYAKGSIFVEDLTLLVFALQELSEIAGRSGIIILAAFRVVGGISSIGSLVTLESYWNTITMPLWVLGHRLRDINSHLVSAERLLQLFRQRATVRNTGVVQLIESLSGEVVFDNVDFAYQGRGGILKRLNMIAKPGETIALVGETGAGKSTIFKLLMRFYDVAGGTITIHGHEIRDIALDSLRNSVGLVPQDPVLFNMSILDNVRYGRLDATDDEVFAACRAASIHDKILTFPRGYASKVGENGVKLSGGERQRIAIARIFLKAPSIVLLDEATSAMDSHTEAAIQMALKELTKGRTTFVIAHRLSTVVEADKILLLHEGQVVESGKHLELLTQRGRYFDLWKRQAFVTASID